MGVGSVIFNVNSRKLRNLSYIITIGLCHIMSYRRT